MAKELTRRQREVLQFIVDYIRESEYPPTFREIGKALNITSTKGVTDHLEVLQKKGYIERSMNHSRAIRILKYPDAHPLAIPSGKLPVVGRIAAGSPIFDEGNIEEFLDLDPSLFGRGTVFALRVKGDSMIDAHICDGDLAIIRKQDKVENGEIAAVMVAGIQEEATLKRFHRTNGSIELRAANSAYPPIKVDPKHTKVEVLGKLVGIIRQE
jgi:repressor LexA